MKIRAILLFLMIAWDASLHWVKLFGKELSYPLYPYFPLLGISYNLFWTIFWTAGAIIMLTIIGNGTVIKNKTINHIHNKISKLSDKDINRLAKELSEEKSRDGEKEDLEYYTSEEKNVPEN